MTPRPATLLLLALIAAAATAGCLGGDPPPRFTVPDGLSDEAAQAGVTEPFTLTVRVTVETADGAPVPDAGVVFYNTTYRTDIILIPLPVGVEERADTVLAAGRTNADGVVVGRLAPGQTISVAAGAADGYTSEAAFNVATGAAGGHGEVTIALYKTRLEVAANATLPATSPDSTRAMREPVWRGTPVAFHPDPAVHAAYVERLHGATATLRWANTATEYADLYAGLAAGDGQPFAVGADNDQPYGEGAHEESVRAAPDALDAEREALLTGGLTAVAITERPVVSHDGLDHAFTVAARFRSIHVDVDG